MADRAVLFIDGNNWYHALIAAGVQTPGSLSYRALALKLIGPREWVGTRLKTGASVREAAAVAGVPVSTAGDIAAKGTGRIRTEKADALADRLLELVEEITKGCIATARLLADPVYLREHKPDEVAVLASALMDRAFKILEAMERAVPGSAWRAERGGEPGEAPRGVVTLYKLPENGRERS